MRVVKDEIEEEEVQSRFGVLNFFFLFVLVAAAAFVFFTYDQIYTKHEHTEFTESIANAIPLPAGSVNGHMFYYHDIFAFGDLAHDEEVDYFSAALGTIARQEIVRELADELDVEVQSVEIDADEWSQYGWTKEQYEKYVLEPIALAVAVDEAIYNSHKYQQSALDEFDRMAELYESGESFDDLAIQYSESSSAQIGGDVGYVCIDDLDEELQGDWTQEVGKLSGVIEYDDRFAIANVYEGAEYELEDGREVEVEEVVEVSAVCDQIGIEIIVIYKQGLEEVLVELEKGVEVRVFGG